MKRIIIGAMVVGLLVAGCGGGGETEVVTVTASPTESEITEVTAASAPTSIRRGELLPEDRAFLSTLDSYWTDSTPNADLIEAGTGICDKLNGGTEMTDILRVLVSEPGAQNEGINLLHSSIVAYCPQYLTGIK